MISENQSSNYFAGFIMTYERPTVLIDTIKKVLNQTKSPELLLVIDNSKSDDTRKAINNLSDQRVIYHRSPGNIGPAGAAKIGLNILSNEGYEWIYWGDDDDPPKFQDEFKNLLEIASNNTNIGAIGSVGSKFNFTSGKLVRFKNEELTGVLDVETIGGNQNMIVSGKAIMESKVLPNDELFFGFEEFEFLQRLKLSGYRLVVSGDSLLKHRTLAGRLSIEKTQKVFRKQNYNSLKRQYYSFRNHIYMFHYTFERKTLAFRIAIKALLKSVLGFKHGLEYGFANAKFLIKAVLHGYAAKLGKRY